MHPMQKPAENACRLVAKNLVKYMDRFTDYNLTIYQRDTLMLRVKEQCETLMIETIQKTFPNHQFITRLPSAEQPQPLPVHAWVHGSICGQSNYQHGYPDFAVTLTYLHNGKPHLSVVYDPLRDELFTCIESHPATLNGRKMRVSTIKNLKQIRFGIYSPSDQPTHANDILKALPDNSKHINQVPILQLMYVCVGRLNAFIGTNINLASQLAGSLFLKEAGGKMMFIKNNGSIGVIAGNINMLPLICEKLKEPIK